MATILDIPDATGCRVIPDLVALRAEYKMQSGQQAGSYLADALPADGWYVAFDMRLDGLPDGFVCERKNADGFVSSIMWDARFIRSYFPPKTQNTCRQVT
jgi:hypothetical protein